MEELRVKSVKYPPYSWLKLSGTVKQNPSRIWFALDKLPSNSESCKITIHIGRGNNSIGDPFDALNEKNVLAPRQYKVLKRLLKIAKPTKKTGEFILDHEGFGKILSFCSAVPFEVHGQGVITPTKQNARIKATLVNNDTNEVAINFSLMKNSSEEIKSPHFFGDINAYVIDDKLNLYQITPNLTEAEARAIVSSTPLPLIGLCQKESRQMFYALSQLGIDFSCLNEFAKPPEKADIVLRLLLSIDDLTKKMCARAHLVTQIEHEGFTDEVEIKSTGSLPKLHICADKNLDEERFLDNVKVPNLLRRPAQKEMDARDFLFHLGSGPSRHHDGFELTGDNALELLKSIGHKENLPSFIKLDEHARPEIIELENTPRLIIKAEEKRPSRVDVALSLGEEFDNTHTNFQELKKAVDNILVLDEDTMVVLNDEIMLSTQYFSETFALNKPMEFKSKSVAQVALLLNALKDRVEIVADDDLKEYLENYSIVIKDEDCTLPKSLVTNLRKYQLDAVSWLSSLSRSGLGGLLGDEMGLGKTLMILTHLARLKELKRAQQPALVICPTSVIDVWKQEAKIHIPSLKVLKWHGLDRFELLDSLNEYDLIITSYATLRRDIATYFANFKFSTLVLDEAQYVRNQQTDSFKSAKAIKCDHRIALTGTPIENHVSDLYNIMDCVEDGLLGNKHNFEKKFGNPIESGETSSAVSLKMLLAPVVTRRKKAQVESELPPKIENIVHCELSEDQKELYAKFVNQLQGEFFEGEKNVSSKGNTHFTLLSALTRLRQICCHPSLVTGEEAEAKSSGKLKALREILSECLESGRKVIIYSQFLKMQEHIVNMTKELDDKGALWLHGSSKDRQGIVSNFQDPDGPRVIVVSLKAGGTGITLTRADTVIFADPWWNPAVEDQAIDRAHRIGQKKTVHVIRLISDNSVECEVVSLAEKKRQAAQTVLHGGFSKAASLSKDEVRSLLLHEIERLKPEKGNKENAN